MKHDWNIIFARISLAVILFVMISMVATFIFFTATAKAQNRGAPQPNATAGVTASATGTTGATTATIPAVQGLTAYLCGFSIRANATAAATGNATVTGLMSGTLNFTQWTAPLASGIGIVEPNLGGCIPASAQNQAIAVVSAAPGGAGVVSVSAWGFYW